jgi:hypothetical protein
MTIALLVFIILDQTRVTWIPNVPAVIRLTLSTKTVPTFLIVSAGILFCAITLQPSEPNVFATDWNFQSLNLNAVPRMLTRIVAGFLPLRHYAIDFWNSSDAIWDRNNWHLGIVGGGILLMSLIALFPSWRLMVAYLGCVLAMELLQQVRYEGHPRHWGQYWVIFVGACWLLRSSFPRRRHVVSLLVMLVALGFQMQGFVAATVWDTKEVFSGGRDTAAFIRQQGLQDLPLLAGPSWQVLSVTGYLRRPFISVETEEFHETVVFHGRRRWFSMPALINRAVSVARERQSPVLVLTNEPLSRLPDGVSVSHLYTSKPSTIDDEVFSVYRLSVSGR